LKECDATALCLFELYCSIEIRSYICYPCVFRIWCL